MKLPLPVGMRWFWEALQGWSKDDVPRLGASLAYYTLLALAPILLIAIAVAGMVFDRESVREQVVSQMQNLIGERGATVIQSMLDALSQAPGGTLAMVIGIGAVLLASLAAFNELQHALNTIFQVKARPGLSKRPWPYLLGVLKDRLISFGMVLSIGFLLLVSLLLSAALAALASWFRGRLVAVPMVWQGLEVILSLLVITLLFGLIYRFLPDVHLAWRDVGVGAIITAVLFTAGKFLIGLYLGHSSIASRYGAAGSVVVILLWVYYSAQVVLLGAEFTRVYVSHAGRTPLPKAHAERDRSRRPSVAREQAGAGRDEPVRAPPVPGAGDGAHNPRAVLRP